MAKVFSSLFLFISCTLSAECNITIITYQLLFRPSFMFHCCFFFFFFFFFFFQRMSYMSYIYQRMGYFIIVIFREWWTRHWDLPSPFDVFIVFRKPEVRSINNSWLNFWKQCNPPDCMFHPDRSVKEIFAIWYKVSLFKCTRWCKREHVESNALNN